MRDAALDGSFVGGWMATHPAICRSRWRAIDGMPVSAKSATGHGWKSPRRPWHFG